MTLRFQLKIGGSEPVRANVKVADAMPMKYHSAPIETTTAEERARGESSFEVARDRQFGITLAGLFAIVAIGCLLLAAVLVFAFTRLIH